MFLKVPLATNFGVKIAIRMYTPEKTNRIRRITTAVFSIACPSFGHFQRCLHNICGYRCHELRSHTIMKMRSELQAGMPALPGLFSDLWNRNGSNPPPFVEL
jgi:hypothetical protein